MHLSGSTLAAAIAAFVVAWCSTAVVAAPTAPSASSAAREADEHVSVRPLRVQVVDEAAADLDASLLPFDATPGTRVTLLLRSPPGERFVSIDTDGSAIVRMTDDAGVELLERESRQRDAEPDAEGADDADNAHDADSADAGAAVLATPWASAPPDGALSGFTRISDDGRLTTVELAAPRTPTAGTAALTLEGRLIVQLAAGTRTHRVGRVSIKADQTLELPEGVVGASLNDNTAPHIEITRVRATRWADYELDVTLEMDRDVYRALAEVRFFDDDGERVISGAFSTLTMGPRAVVQYGLGKALETATVELIFHDDVRDVEVPVRLNISLGL